MPRPITRVMSLGAACWTAALIEDAGLRRGSGPFDWTFTDPRLVFYCLGDDFRLFADRAAWERVGSDSQWSLTRLRALYRLGPITNHHDLGRDEDFERLQRAVGRMREALRPGARSLFVVMTDTRNLQYRSFVQLRARLRQKAPDSDLLAIGLNPGPPQPRPQGTLRAVERADGYRRYSFSPGAPTTDGLRFPAPGDGALLRSVFEPYSLSLEASAPEAD